MRSPTWGIIVINQTIIKAIRKATNGIAKYLSIMDRLYAATNGPQISGGRLWLSPAV
jgi:hypothetical protein